MARPIQLVQMQDRSKPMKKTLLKGGGLAALMLSTVLAAPTGSQAAIPGISGPTFSLEAKANFISTPDGGVTYMWLFDGGPTNGQYPGPTLIVNQGDDVTVNVTNSLGNQAAAMPISFTAPGLNVYCSDCADGPGGSVGPLTPDNTDNTGTYQFTASRPGTFSYYSDYRTGIGVGMGLVGAIIVRPNNFAHVDNPNAPVPTGGATQKAYGSNQTVYDHEYLVVSTDIDVDYHAVVRGVGQQDWETCANLNPVPTDCSNGSAGKIAALTEALRNLEQTTAGGRTLKGFFPEYWMINGRSAFDNFQYNNLPWLPTQPYSGIAQIHPGQTALVRFVGAGRQIHPFHPHGDEVPILAVDGRLADAGPGNSVVDPLGAAPNLQWREYTIDQNPGQTVDVTWNWMPKGLGFDVYGNAAGAYTTPPATGADCISDLTWDPDTDFRPFVDDPICIVDIKDRGVPLPTSQPPLSDLAFGGFWSGSAFLGKFGVLPPGEGGLNANGGLAFIWHSHREKELINKDVFPGGLLSIMMVEPFVDADGAEVEIPRGSCFDTNNGPAPGSGC
jgi:manganese oxidase